DLQDPENTSWIDIPISYYLPDNEEGLLKLIYLSHDQATPLERDRAETEMLYLVEHLNTLKFPGFPPPNYNLRSEHPLCF
ncbi:hypothetical protein Tco_0456797, partial [Tanacetum coccineum]